MSTPAPEPPTDIGDTHRPALTQARYQEELDAWLEQVKADIAKSQANDVRADSDRANEVALRLAVHNAYLTVSQGSLDRANTRVNILTTAIATVTTLYTGLLALVYAAKPGDGAELTPTALIPALFLGVALLLVAIYAAMFGRGTMAGNLLPTSVGGTMAEERVKTFINWCSAAILSRKWALFGGIVSFGVAIATLPLPFVSPSSTLTTVILIAGTALVVGTVVLVSVIQ